MVEEEGWKRPPPSELGLPELGQKGGCAEGKKKTVRYWLCHSQKRGWHWLNIVLYFF